MPPKVTSNSSPHFFRSFHLEDLPCPAWFWNISDKKIYFNSKWVEFAGQGKKQGKATAFAKRIHSADRASWEQAFDKARRDGNDFMLECRFKLGARYVAVLQSIRPCGERSVFEGFFAIVHAQAGREKIRTWKKAGALFERKPISFIQKIKSALPHAPLPEGMEKFSPKEWEVCDLIREGYSSKEISHLLNISPLTVSKHRNRIRKKLGLSKKAANLVTFLKMASRTPLSL